MERYLSAREAAARLGIDVRSLYAYVSRGRVRSVPGTDPHRRHYLAQDVEAIAQRKAIGRRPAQISSSTLNWGYPVLQTSITEIARNRLLYRGQEMTALAQEASLEETARLLWKTKPADPFRPSPPPEEKLRPVGRSGALARAVSALSLAGQELSPIMGRASAALWTEGAALMRVLAAALMDGRWSAAPFHEQLARRWRLGREQADWIRRALVACADHELNASTFAARIIASTGASLSSCLVGGLEALSGPRHGSATLRLKAWLETVRGQKRLRQMIREQLDRGERLPGFGHPLYPEGDPRAQVVLAKLPPDRKREAVVAAVEDLTGLRPNIDFGLIALTEAVRRPAPDALTLFALGRSAGWIAHAIEQNETGTLIRPRATFRSPAPDDRG